MPNYRLQDLKVPDSHICFLTRQEWISGIFDHTLAALLNGTANDHGDNIKEGAADGGAAGGAFTQALLPTFKSSDADKPTYTSLFKRTDKIPSQNPQCERLNQNRIIFDSRAPTTGRTTAGEAEDLLLFAPLDGKLLALYETLAMAFDILDPHLAEHGLTRMPHPVENNLAARFYWHLNCEVKDALVNIYTYIECMTLKPTSDYDSSGNAILKPTGDNLLQLVVIDVVASDRTMYGYKITNNSARVLHIYSFYFDNSNFSFGNFKIILTTT
ncbi:uncharacterized protein LACBIDRAFT_329722 [Laccaria bicolor S238N-H82]|uniref:Predicted protein n=1 Tax=Laccaria bicolor (strain S238N-H82 / ATCC MYA-4686) TaxID=486041 RepID=B0DJ08_LACBS|nr:uncharacterized protein LACBIDRAFT_329722 [Laccaria bicolor S238N-H82]EDR05436.1 predicted protein [Laccaria bicolor S238N-H82]|eukprot:XP_001883994.1 predicted protein [Laccaria bicolor S238N-H82]